MRYILHKGIDTITLPGLETEVAVTGIRVSVDVINHATVTLFYSTVEPLLKDTPELRTPLSKDTSVYVPSE